MRPVQSSKLTQLTIFLPVIGYLIFFNDKVTGWLVFNNLSSAESDLFLTSRVRLQLLYFGTLFLGASALVYRFQCPKSVQTYSDIKEHRYHASQRLDASEVIDLYLQLEKQFGFGKFSDTPFSRENLNNFVYQAYDITSDMLSETEDDEFWALRSEVVNYTKARVENHDFISAILDSEYIYGEVTNPRSYHLTLAFTATGLLLLLIPSADVFFSVLFDLLQ